MCRAGSSLIDIQDFLELSFMEMIALDSGGEMRMATFDKHEANRFAEAAAAAGQEYLETRGKVLSDGAGRGFPMVPGESLSALVQAGLKARQKLTELHGKIYEEERDRLLELSTFNLKLIVETGQNRQTDLPQRLEAVLRKRRSTNCGARRSTTNSWWSRKRSAWPPCGCSKMQVRLTLKQYENDIRGQVLALKVLLDEGKIDLNLLVRLARLTVEEDVPDRPGSE